MKEKDFRQIIKLKRKELGFSQKDLAGLLGIRPSTLSNYENGKTELGADKLEKIFSILRIKVN